MHQTYADQLLHDHVIREIVREARGWLAFANYGEHPGIHLGIGRQDACPDVLLCDRESFLVHHAIEVETMNTVSSERVPHWRQTTRAAEPRGVCWLLVPEAAVAHTTLLCRQYGIPARIGTWSVRPDGIVLNWAPRRARIALPGLLAIPTPPSTRPT